MNVSMDAATETTTATATTIDPLKGEGDRLQGFLTNEEWGRLLVSADELIKFFENLEDQEVRAKVFDLLHVLDKIHRESLTRLVRLFKDGVLEQVIRDPPIGTLMELYDLLPESKSCSSRAEMPVSLAGQNVARWIPANLNKKLLKQGHIYGDHVDQTFMFICIVDKKYYAFSNECMVDNTPMFGARLDKHTLICPHHQGCAYDIRNGARLGNDSHLACYPIKVESEKLLIGFDMPFVPDMPSY